MGMSLKKAKGIRPKPTTKEINKAKVVKGR
jgi:hypothetical protein